MNGVSKIQDTKFENHKTFLKFFGKQNFVIKNIFQENKTGHIRLDTNKGNFFLIGDVKTLVEKIVDVDNKLLTLGSKLQNNNKNTERSMFYRHRTPMSS